MAATAVDERVLRQSQDLLAHRASFKAAASIAADDDAADRSGGVRRSNDSVSASEECAVCLESLATGDVVKLSCGHSFHSDCVEGIRKFGVAQTCPMCRATLPPVGSVLAKLFLSFRQATN